MGLKVLVGNEDKVLEQLKEDIVCGILQYPGTLGDIKNPSEAISKIHKKNGKAILACDLLALAKLKTPRELGADIAVGSSQRFGIPNLCELPTAMSAPSSPGVFNLASANKSQAKIALPFFL